MDAKPTASEIIDQNIAVIEEFFTGIANGNYYNGMCWRLYLDMRDSSIIKSVRVGFDTKVYRNDGSLIEIARAHGYIDTPEDELFTDGCDLMDFKYGEWLSDLEERIAEALADS